MRKSFILFCIYLFCVSCLRISEQNDIYEYIPKGTKLTPELLQRSSSILPYDEGIILVVDLSSYLSNQDDYNPHLLFFNKEGAMYSACYFPSESFYYYKDNRLTVYINEHRYQRISAFRNDIPNGFDINLKRYSGNKLPSTVYLDRGTVESLKYDEKSKMVNIFFKKNKDSIASQLNVPLYKVSYNYNSSKIMVNNVINESDKTKAVLKIHKLELLNEFLINIPALRRVIK